MWTFTISQIFRKLTYSYSIRYYSKKFAASELALCYIISKDRKNNEFTSSSKLFKLEKNGVLRTRLFDILHENIIDRTETDCTFAVLELDKRFIKIKRPSLYDYMREMSRLAVSSHFSILSLAPFLMEIDKNFKVLESGTGNGCMTLQLSKHLHGTHGEIHTYDWTDVKVKSAETNFLQWINSHNVTNTEKWLNNAKFYRGNITDHQFDEKFHGYYDAIYLDLLNPHLALKNVSKLLRTNGIIVINSMQLLTLVDCINVITKYNLGLHNELVLESSMRSWTIERPERVAKAVNLCEDSDLNLAYKCRPESPLNARNKSDETVNNYWPGYLMKLRKIH
jgi:tRNA A58 N-methylase Trm61